jgi:hypothetical protein
MEKCRYVLKNKFQKKIFEKLLEKYEFAFLEKELEICSQEIYAYKNLKVKSISKALLEKVTLLLKISPKELKKNISGCFGNIYWYAKRLDNNKRRNITLNLL